MGTGIRIVDEFGKETTQRDNFNDTIRFNVPGYFDSAPGDPLDLIPLYPGHAEGEDLARVRVSVSA